MKLEVNHDACIGCGACVIIDDENLDFDENGYVIPINQNITNKTYEAKNSCPVDAISIIEEENKNDKS